MGDDFSTLIAAALNGRYVIEPELDAVVLVAAALGARQGRSTQSGGRSSTAPCRGI